jgi:hypothetical protein
VFLEAGFTARYRAEAPYKPRGCIKSQILPILSSPSANWRIVGDLLSLKQDTGQKIAGMTT